MLLFWCLFCFACGMMTAWLVDFASNFLYARSERRKWIREWIRRRIEFSECTKCAGYHDPKKECYS